MTAKSRQRLGERELGIMRALWQKGRATVAEVQRELIDEGSEVAYTTVQTMLNRMEAKGLVARDDSDRAHRYRPLLKEPTAVSGAIRRLTDRFFSGSVEALATRLVEKELSPEQLERIQALIDAHRNKESSK
ncbi:MAG TPA: BlaI/MecI/CopY family transcriptional regulator [Pyrinomonadaceae bacterium]|nr:BlaI/MecI/CopY family transcriptional regulator [Pyrinomonadaceae bacterium]